VHAAVTIAAIALAIGLNVAVASVVEGVLLKGMPFVQADRLAFISGSPTFTTEFYYPKLTEIAQQNTTFENVAGSVGESSTFESTGGRVTLFGLDVTGNYFATLGVKPVLGRALNDADLGQPNAIVSERVWRTYFGARADVLGRPLRLGDKTLRIVGVLPTSFRVPYAEGLTQFDYYTALDPYAPANTTRSIAAYDAVVRLRAGVPPDRARADLQRVLDSIHLRHPQDDTQRPQAALTPIADAIVGPVRPLLLLLYAAVTGIFLIACANVASLALVRAVTREPELALRTALGATRRRIASQLLAESFVLAVAGGLVGTLLGWGVLKLFAAVLPQMLPRWEDVAIDARVLWYALALVAITAVTIGVLPSFSVQSIRRRSKRRVHAAFVSLQIALAMAVLVTAGLLVRSFVGLTHVQLGFDPQDVYAVRVDLQAARFNDFPTEQATLQNIVQRIAALPGVAQAAAAAHLPFSNDSSMPISTRAGESPALVTLSIVGSGYLQTLHIPLLRGRTFDAQDRSASASVALVNAAFARQFFGGADAVGRFIYAGNSAIRIVGVTGDTRKSLALPPPPRVYLPVAQVPGFRSYELAVRTQPGRRIAASALISAATSADTAIPQPSIRSLTDIVASNGAHARFAAMLFAVLALAGLVLSLSGLYAVTSYAVERRTREFGIRRAIGARASNVLANVMSEALMNALAGISAGIVLIALSAGALQTLLYQTPALDPLTFAAAVVLLVFCATLAALVPAGRAIRIEPARALRHE
jgi:putative ABC transport system permease protein